MTRKLTSAPRPPPQTSGRELGYNIGDNTNSAGLSTSTSDPDSAAPPAMAPTAFDVAAAGSRQECEQVESLTYRMRQAGFDAPQSRGAGVDAILQATWLPRSDSSSDPSSSSELRSAFPVSLAPMTATNPSTRTLIENQVEGVIDIGQADAAYQPVLDSSALEPLDDTSLELLVISLAQIGGDPELSQATSAVADGVGGADCADAMPQTSLIPQHMLGKYLQRTPDLSESCSDSSSVSSNSPGRVGPGFNFDIATGGSGGVFDSGAVVGAARSGPADSRGSANATTRINTNAGVVVVKKPKRIRRLCTQPSCGKRARSHGLCIAHGGGRRCAVEGCEKSSQGGNMCIKHGGGKRCNVSGCNRAAQTHGLCKAHGGGPRCQVEGCTKSSQGGGFCRTHGGGKRCAAEGCTKGTQRGDYCALHGGSRFCEVSGCRRNDRGGGLCAHHGGGKRCGILNCTRPCRRNGYCSTHLRLLGDDETGDDQP